MSRVFPGDSCCTNFGAELSCNNEHSPGAIIRSEPYRRCDVGKFYPVHGCVIQVRDPVMTVDLNSDTGFVFVFV